MVESVTVCFPAPRQVVEELDDLAKRAGFTSRSEFLRHIVLEYVVEHGRLGSRE